MLHLKVKLDVIKSFNHSDQNKDVVHALIFESGNPKLITYKLTVIASLVYVILAYERFHKNAPLSDSGENLYIGGLLFLYLLTNVLWLQGT